jgi:3-hydroxyacyl-CoA dehydrogenase
VYKKKTGIDIIAKILDALYKLNPDALFVMSLMHQYEERGSLSKKQLEGLYSKASKEKEIPANWLGTLEAIILKMPTRYKSTETIVPSPIYKKDEGAGRLIAAILEKYPQHKRVLFLRSKYENNEMLINEEIVELRRFGKLPGVAGNY